MPPAPVNRDDLPAKWPTHEGAPVFWEEIGRTVAAFGFLEDVLARAYFALTATREYAIIDEAEAAFPGWPKNLERSLTDTLASLTAKIGEAFENDDRVLPAVGSAIVGRLCELRIWRNALCHGAWVQFEADGSARLRHFRKTEAGPEMLDTCLSLEDIVNIRAETVDITILVRNTVTQAGIQFPGTAARADSGLS